MAKRLIQIEYLKPERYGFIDFLRDCVISVASAMLIMLIAKITHSWPFE